MSLLNEAKKITTKHRFRDYTQDKNKDEYIEVALAWARDEVSLSQIAEAMGYASTSNAYLMLARALKAHIIKNKL